MDKNTHSLLEAQDWREISKFLTKHAAGKAKRLSWRTGSYGELPCGKTPDDIAAEAILKVLNGERQWNPDKDQDLLKYLYSVVDSDVSHLVNSFDNKNLQSLPDDEVGLSQFEADQLEKSRRPKTPEDEVLANEHQERMLTRAYEAADGDKQLEALITAIEAGCSKRREIAEFTEMTVYQVSQSRRKLQRRLQKSKASDKE